MAYDANSRPSRGAAEVENEYYQPRDTTTSRSRTSSSAKRPNKETMAAAAAADSSAYGVSPELIAIITARVKQELMEHIKGSSDDLRKSSPVRSAPSNRSSSTSSPPPPQRVYTPPSPTQTYTSKPAEPVRRTSPPAPADKPSGVRFSDRSLPTRPGAGPRSYSTVELSTIDQKWGRLFEGDGRPTERLGQFLRGLANHIIEEFPPKKSIVVTPPKMGAFYASHALENERHPLVSIFRAQSNEQISMLYQDLGCQHHLVQDSVLTGSSLAPTVPALTATGFAHWLSIFILAYPEEEYKRLEKVVLALPIDADGQYIDGKPERLPKQISRHLLPEREDKKSRKLIETAFDDFFNDLGATSRRKASITSPPLSRHPSNSQNRSRPVEIHQNKKISPQTSAASSFSGAPSTTSETERNAVKIERERAPYTAQPGSGKIYTDNSSQNAPASFGRGDSSSSRVRERIPDPLEVTTETRHRTQSSASQNVPSQRGSSRRASSPPLKKFSHSTPDDLGGYQYGPAPTSATTPSFSVPPQSFVSSSYGPTKTVPPPPPIIDPRDRHADDRQYRRPVHEEPRLTGDFNSPRDAERWDRFQESRADSERAERRESKASASTSDSRDARPGAAAYEDYYRETLKNKGVSADGYSRY